MIRVETYAQRAAWLARAEQPPDADGLALAAGGNSLPGVCALCGGTSGFGIDGDAARPGTSLRESLHCRRCGCNARQRAAAWLLLQDVADPGAEVYLSEQASPLFVALRRRLQVLHGSEFASGAWQRLRLSAWLWRRGVLQRVRREDATALSFPDTSLAAVVSLDVLEHIPDYRAALQEFARVLRPGGSLVLSVPFYDDRDDTKTLAMLRADGGIHHLQPPEYHGDPLGGGVLCFHHFGWDLLDALRAAGFDCAHAVRVGDADAGLPQPLWLLHARR